MGIKLRWRTLHVITLHDHLEQIERFGPLSRLSVKGESSNSPPIAGPGGVGGQRSHCGTSGGDPRAQATVEPKVPTLGASGGRGTSRWHRDGVRRDLRISSDVGHWQVPSCPQSPRSSRATGPCKWPLFNKGPEDGRAVSPHIYRAGHRDVRAGAGFRSRPHWHACDHLPGPRPPKHAFHRPRRARDLNLTLPCRDRPASASDRDLPDLSLPQCSST